MGRAFPVSRMHGWWGDMLLVRNVLTDYHRWTAMATKRRRNGTHTRVYNGGYVDSVRKTSTTTTQMVLPLGIYLLDTET